MSYPNIKFNTSLNKDFDTLCAFVKDAKYDNGRNLDWAIFKKYPQLKKYFNKDDNFNIIDKEDILKFLDNQYQSNAKEMKIFLKKHEENWLEVSSSFYSLVDELFDKSKWPKGKYIAYGTIWGMFPRFLEDKTF